MWPAGDWERDLPPFIMRGTVGSAAGTQARRTSENRGTSFEN